jgi:hypothetical protein
MATQNLRNHQRRPRHLLRALALMALCIAAILCPLLSAVAIMVAGDSPSQSAFINAGSLTALFLSPLIAVRTGRLRDFFVGPVFGLIAGFLDLEAMLWLYGAGCSISVAACVPAWAATLALWTASARRCFLNSLLVFAVIVFADVASRIFWVLFGPPIVFGESVLVEWQELIEALVYAPAAFLTVLLAHRTIDRVPREVATPEGIGITLPDS